MLDREHSIRSVVRDRDILVGRLIKASKKKVSKKDSGLSQDEKMEKVNAGQRELHACEQVLASEEAALVGVKRRTFKEALTMRMKTMGDAGSAMVDAAKEAILLLDEFDTHGPLLQATGGGQYESMYADDGVVETAPTINRLSIPATTPASSPTRPASLRPSTLTTTLPRARPALPTAPTSSATSMAASTRIFTVSCAIQKLAIDRSRSTDTPLCLPFPPRNLARTR